MAILTFKYGKNLSSSTPFTAGAIYLDTETNELWYDNPSDENSEVEHQKVIDTSTLIYEVVKTVTFGGNAATSGNTAVLGTAVLGTMILGNE